MFNLICGANFMLVKIKLIGDIFGPRPQHGFQSFLWPKLYNHDPVTGTTCGL